MRFAAFSDSVPGTSSAEVLDIQGRLIQLGYTLDPNGAYDSATSAAILDFREKMGIPVVDRIDGALITAFGMVGRPEYAGKFGGGMGTGMKVALGLFGVAVLAFALNTRG
ncbi:MAG: peptidoglycan-binding protein [Minisyncoccia bacterium]